MKRTVFSAPFVATIAIAAYLLTTWWRTTKSEALLFLLHNMLLTW